MLFALHSSWSLASSERIKHLDDASIKACLTLAFRLCSLVSADAMGVNKKAIKAMFSKEKWKILRGDKVVITAGKDKGQAGIVTKVIRDEKIPRVIVEGRNLVRACS